MTTDISKDENADFYTNEELYHALQIRKSTRTYSGVELKLNLLKTIFKVMRKCLVHY